MTNENGKLRLLACGAHERPWRKLEAMVEVEGVGLLWLLEKWIADIVDLEAKGAALMTYKVYVTKEGVPNTRQPVSNLTRNWRLCDLVCLWTGKKNKRNVFYGSMKFQNRSIGFE